MKFLFIILITISSTLFFNYAQANSESKYTCNKVLNENIIQYDLTTLLSPYNGGTISLSPPGGIYNQGEIVTVSVTAANGYTFNSWSGASNGSNTTVQVEMTDNLSITANFSQQSVVAGNHQANFDQIGFSTLNGGTTGGAGGGSVIVYDAQTLQDMIENKGAQPLTIYVSGKITPPAGLTKIDVKDVNDISILGLGSGAEFEGIGILIKRANNIILRNLKIHHVDIGGKDCLGIEGPASNIWVDHCELYNEFQGVVKDYYDGLFDVKKEVDYITFSWNYLHDSWKCSLSGSSDSDNHDRTITYHHNLYENINSRLPLFRSGRGHIFNNYYLDIGSTVINSRVGACILAEHNFFENAFNPLVSAYSDVLGATDQIGNYFINSPSNFSQTDVSETLDCTLDVPYPYINAFNAIDSLPSMLKQNAGVGVLYITTNIDAIPCSNGDLLLPAGSLLSGTYKANDHIFCGGKIIADTNLRGTECVQLFNDFSTPSSLNFTAINDGCVPNSSQKVIDPTKTNLNFIQKK